MGFDKTNKLWLALRRYPNGTTAKVIAADLKWQIPTTSAALGKLAMYDVIDRVPHPTQRGYRYQVRRAA